MEEFKDIKGHEGHYKINKKGEVISIERYAKHNNNGRQKIKQKKLKATSYGKYVYVTLSKNGVGRPYCIHRLKAIAFIPNPENKPEVNHIDGNKLNNDLENLEWVTKSEQAIHAHKLGLTPPPPIMKGKNNSTSKPIEELKDDIVVKTYETVRDAAAINGLTSNMIIRICRGAKTKKSKKVFRYKNQTEI